MILDEGKGKLKTERNIQEKVTERIEELELEVFREWCLKQYSYVFKDELSPDDVIKWHKELEFFMGEFDKVKPVNYMTSTETPVHLEKAASKELNKILKADFLEPCHHPTDWCLCGFYVKKQYIKEGKEVRVRLVSDFRPLNRHLKRPGYPNESSSQLLKKIDPKSKNSTSDQQVPSN